MMFMYVLFISTVIGYIHHKKKTNRNEVNASNIKYKKCITLTMKNHCEWDLFSYKTNIRPLDSDDMRKKST